MDDKIKGLFPITQAAAACGLSRSTLMRMEKKGLLTPAYIAPESGRRYQKWAIVFSIPQAIHSGQFH